MSADDSTCKVPGTRVCVCVCVCVCKVSFRFILILSLSRGNELVESWHVMCMSCCIDSTVQGIADVSARS